MVDPEIGFMAVFAKRVRRQSRRDKAAQARRERSEYTAYLHSPRVRACHDGISHGTRIRLSARERRELKRLVNASKSGQALVMRARIIQLAAAGLSNNAISEVLGLDLKTVRKWRDRKPILRRVGLEDAPRSGRPPIFTPEQRHE